MNNPLEATDVNTYLHCCSDTKDIYSINFWHQRAIRVIVEVHSDVPEKSLPLWLVIRLGRELFGVQTYWLPQFRRFLRVVIVGV